MTERPLREPLDELVDELARATSEPPPRSFEADAGVVRQALQDRVGLDVTDEQLADALSDKAGRAPSGEWVLEAIEGDRVRFKRVGDDG